MIGTCGELIKCRQSVSEMVLRREQIQRSAPATHTG